MILFLPTSDDAFRLARPASQIVRERNVVKSKNVSGEGWGMRVHFFQRSIGLSTFGAVYGQLILRPSPAD